MLLLLQHPQFRRVANLYFLATAVLSLTPFSPVRAWTTWAPLVIVLSISMAKEVGWGWRCGWGAVGDVLTGNQ